LQVQLLLTVAGSTVDSSSGNITAGGIQLENGTDGTVDTDRKLPMYNSTNNLEADRDYLNSRVLLAYQERYQVLMVLLNKFLSVFILGINLIILLLVVIQLWFRMVVDILPLIVRIVFILLILVEK